MSRKGKFQLLMYIIGLHMVLNLLYHGSLVTLFHWMGENILLFSLNYFFLLGISLVLISFTNLQFGVILTSLATLTLSFISYKKYNMRTSRLIISDVLQVDEILAISDNVFRLNPMFIMLCLISVLVFSYIVFKSIGNTKVNSKERSVFLIAGVCITIIVYLIPVNYAVENKGLFLDLTKNNSTAIYSKAIEKPLIEVFEQDETLEINNNIDRPNIVIIMSESYWDLRKLKNIGYNKELYKNFDLMSKEGVSGYLETPEFGGGTSNVEFEVLTGHSAHFFPPGYIFYNEEKDRKLISSLPGYLKKLGYKTTALHSYEGWYYNRETIYQSMSFDDFISSEDMTNKKEKGFYISDETVTDYIIKMLDTHEEPQFIFAITMQNHGPYNDERYGKNQEVQLLNKSENEQILKTYGQGIYDADQALGKLYNYINASKDETMVVFFGDHLPTLGENFKVYKEEKFIENNTELNNKVRLSSVPFFIWTNFTNKREQVKLLNVSYLGAYILDYLDINKDPYFLALSKLKEKLPVISRTYGLNKNHTLMEARDEKYIKYQEEYRNLQFSVLKKDLYE